MGTLTHEQLRDEVREHMGNRTDITDAKLTTALNLSQVRMARMHDFRELQTTETGTLTFADVPATDKFVNFSTILSSGTIDDVISFILHDGTTTSRSRKLERWTPRQLDQLVPNSALASVSTFLPEYYIMWNDKFELYRIPDQAYSYIVRLIVRPIALTTDSQTSDFEDSDDLLIFLATSYYFNKLGEHDRANQFFVVFGDEFKKRKDDDLDNPDKNIKPRHVDLDVGVIDYWNNPFIRSVR